MNIPGNARATNFGAAGIIATPSCTQVEERQILLFFRSSREMRIDSVRVTSLGCSGLLVSRKEKGESSRPSNDLVQ